MQTELIHIYNSNGIDQIQTDSLQGRPLNFSLEIKLISIVAENGNIAQIAAKTPQARHERGVAAESRN
jgi:hypothetical protein